LGFCDPLARATARDCVRPSALREYTTLAASLSARLGVAVELRYYPFDAGLIEAVRARAVDAVIAKAWTTLRAAKESRREFERLADLPTPKGSADLTGVFIVRRDSSVRTLADLDGKPVLLGPDGAYEKSFAAKRALSDAKATPSRVEVIDGCIPLAAAVLERKADGGVVSSYVADFGGLALVGDAAEFRQIARTKPVPFMTFAASTELDASYRAKIRAALLEISGQHVPEDLYTTGFTAPAPWEPEEVKP
jgi:ABC-type phosphate/phosphonate transport system substrate-binding protein